MVMKIFMFNLLDLYALEIHKVWISGAELYSMYVGEGETLLQNTFQRARLAAPSIIFFDEIDVVAAKRLVCLFCVFITC